MNRISHVVQRGLWVALIGILMGAPAALAGDEPSKQGTAPSGDVQERGIQRGTFGGPLPGRMTPGGGTMTPGGTVSALTKAECTGLGCKAVTDNTCPDVGALRERCVCKAGTKGVCIDAVK